MFELPLLGSEGPALFPGVELFADGRLGSVLRDLFQDKVDQDWYDEHEHSDHNRNDYARRETSCIFIDRLLSDSLR